jgi:outer membrane lipoprotein carrier protein
MSSNNNMLEDYGTIPDTYTLPARHENKPGRTLPFRKFWRKKLSDFKNNLFPLFSGFFCLISFFTLMVGVPSQGLAEMNSLTELTTKMQDVYDHTRDLKAGFVQEVTIKSMKKTEREVGTLWIKNPRMMYWDYKKPKIKKLIINAKKAWLFVDEDRIAYLQSADDVYRSRLVVKFLSGIGKLSEDFSVRFSKDGHTDADGNYLLKLTAKERGIGIEQIDLAIDKKTFQIIKCSFADEYGNATRLSFHNIQTNTGVSDTFFTFAPPVGVEVVNMP